MKKTILKTKTIIKRLRSINYFLSLKLIFMRNVILCYWLEHPEKNFGDDLNPWMLQRMTGKTIINSQNVINFKRILELSFIGSILGEYPRRKMLVIGSGLISQDVPLQYKKGSIFLSVRGPLSRQILINSGYICPEIYGDPALLLPFFYSPNIINKKYKLGVIPHYVDKEHPIINKLRIHKSCTIIDIQGEIETIINEINTCELIVSSSLHGLIVADAYGIPSKWVEFSDKVFGEGFKFRDYFLSVNRNKMLPYKITTDTDFKDLMGLFSSTDNPEFDISIMLDSLPNELRYFINKN